MTTDFQRVVGMRLRALREERGLTEGQIAIAARQLGVSWRRSTVSTIELGGRNLRPEELLLIPLIFLTAAPDRQPPSLLELLEGSLRLTPAVVLHADQVRQLLVGYSRLPHQKIPPMSLDDFRATYEVMQREYEKRGYGMIEWSRDPDQLFLAESGIIGAALDEPVQRIARQLKVHAIEVSTAAFFKWGRMYLNEREARAEAIQSRNPKLTLKAARQQASREMIEELPAALAALNEEKS
jgi:transcriptional regulator with XRE-family HTH domain